MQDSSPAVKMRLSILVGSDSTVLLHALQLLLLLPSIKVIASVCMQASKSMHVEPCFMRLIVDGAYTASGALVLAAMHHPPAASCYRCSVTMLVTHGSIILLAYCTAVNACRTLNAALDDQTCVLYTDFFRLMD
jgi:hypothetical protein